MTREDLTVAGKLAKIMKYAALISLDRDADVFVYYDPHVQVVEIDIHLRGWDANKSPDVWEHIYLTGELARTEELDRAERILRRMWQEKLDWNRAARKESREWS